jgi:hypothetical protein
MMDLRFDGETVIDVLYEYTLILNTDGKCRIRIECPFVFSKAGLVVSVDPAQNEHGEWEDHLVGQQITTATADDDGTFHATLTNGVSLTCPPSDDYEAWTVTRPNNNMIVCLAEGELAIWGYEDQPYTYKKRES